MYFNKRYTVLLIAVFLCGQGLKGTPVIYTPEPENISIVDVATEEKGEDGNDEEDKVFVGYDINTVDEYPDDSGADSGIEIVDVLPSFMDGDIQTFRRWLYGKISYPVEAMEYGISGTVRVSFIIEKDGRLNKIKVEESPHKLLSDEVVRVLKLSPKWKPGENDGKHVRVMLNLPVEFKFTL